MTELSILKKTHQLWNRDKTSISLDHNMPKVLAMKDIRPYSVTAGKSTNITYIAAGSAAGEVLPPYKNFKIECAVIKEGVSPGTVLKGRSMDDPMHKCLHHFSVSIYVNI